MSFDTWLEQYEIKSRQFRAFPHSQQDGPRILTTEFKIPCDLVYLRLTRGIKVEFMYPRTCLGCMHMVSNGYRSRCCAHPDHVVAYGVAQYLGTRDFRHASGKQIPRTPSWCPVLSDPTRPPEPESIQ